jgi:hypothetical protein
MNDDEVRKQAKVAADKFLYWISIGLAAIFGVSVVSAILTHRLLAAAFYVFIAASMLIQAISINEKSSLNL